MSLDITLFVDYEISVKSSGIFIRRNGRAEEITREEWDALYPDREPMIVKEDSLFGNIVFSANITHNLNEMADAAGIYKCMWRPEELGITKAKELIEMLEKGLHELKTKPDHFKTFNPPNGWGTYEGFVEFVEDYLAACKRYPEAEIHVSR